MKPKAYRRGSNGNANETTSQQISRLEHELEQSRDEARRINNFREDLRHKFTIVRDERDMLTAGLVEAVKAFEFPAISAGNAESMAWHSKRGKPWCGIPKEAFEEWLLSTAKGLRELDKALSPLTPLLKEGK